MIKLAANLTMLFNEVPFMERFAISAEHGFTGVEFLFPYAWPASDILHELKRHNLTLVLHNLPAGNWDAGERGIACHPDRIDEFKQGVDQTIHYATQLGTSQINCLAGIKPQQVEPEQARQTLIANLRYAAECLKKANLNLLVEPINTFDIPGFFLSRSDAAIEIIKQTDADNLFLQYDIYHMQRMEGELINTMLRHLPIIRHIQLADNPGRHEPGTGEINYRTIFAALVKAGYSGWIGCEYKPLLDTVSGLCWRETHQI